MDTAPLPELIATQLSALSLRNDEETVEFVVGLVEEESFEPEVRSDTSIVSRSIATTALTRRIETGPQERNPWDARGGRERRCAERSAADCDPR